MRGEIDALLCFQSSAPLPDLLRCSEAGRGGVSSSFSADSHRMFLRKTLKQRSELMTRATPEISGRLKSLYSGLLRFGCEMCLNIYLKWGSMNPLFSVSPCPSLF